MPDAPRNVDHDGSISEEEEEDETESSPNLQDELQEFRQTWQRELKEAGQFPQCDIAPESQTVEEQVFLSFSLSPLSLRQIAIVQTNGAKRMEKSWPVKVISTYLNVTYSSRVTDS